MMSYIFSWLLEIQLEKRNSLKNNLLLKNTDGTQKRRASICSNNASKNHPHQIREWKPSLNTEILLFVLGETSARGVPTDAHGEKSFRVNPRPDPVMEHSTNILTRL